MSNDNKPLEGAVVKFKVGQLEILGTEGDFRESPSEVLSGGFRKSIEKKNRVDRRLGAKREIDVLRNRFDRMKSYCNKAGIDWRIDYWDYCRLWETAPDIYDPEKGREVPAIEYSDRKSKLRACRVNPRDRFVDRSNLCLKIRGRIFHGPLRPKA